MRAKDSLGQYGEAVAAAHLESLGLVLLARNWRCREGELDIIARDGDCLVVCEVKTRSSMAFGSPAEAVDWRKLGRLRRLCGLWLAQSDERFGSIRIDIVAVLPGPGGEPRVEHLVGVS